MVIFDFDLTLVDTQPVEELRAARRWRAVMSRVGELPVYEGVTELLQALHSRGQKLAIVTKSPNMIPLWFVEQHNWPVKIVLGHHQVAQPKPAPDGLLMAMRLAKATSEGTFHVGDKPEDTEASKAANVTSLGAAWGGVNTDLLAASNPDYLFDTVAQLGEQLLMMLPRAN